VASADKNDLNILNILLKPGETREGTGKGRSNGTMVYSPAPPPSPPTSLLNNNIFLHL